MPPNLCDFCSQIDFGLLRLPRASELKAVNEGRPPPDHHPFKSLHSKFGNSHGVPHWNLGLRSRIDRESACKLCSAIGHVLRRALVSKSIAQRQWARAKDHNLLCVASIDECASISLSKDVLGNASPPRVNIRHISLQWLRPGDEDCQTPGRINLRRDPDGQRTVLSLNQCFQLQARNLSVHDVMENISPGPDAELFGGRLVPELIDPRLPRRWLEDCRLNHGDTCGKSLSGIPRCVGRSLDHA